MPLSLDRFFPELRRLLQEHFSLEEMRTLCQDLNVDPEEIPGSDIVSRARETVEYFKRRVRINELLTQCQKERPGVVWPVPPELTRATSRTRAIIGLFRNLGEWLKNLNVRENLIEFRTTFKRTRADIRIIMDYKRLHDELHDLEVGCFANITVEKNRLRKDRNARRNLETQERIFRDIVDELRTIVQRRNVKSEEQQWVEQLDNARKILKTGITEPIDLEKVESSITTTRGVLEVTPFEVNEKLKTAVQELRFRDLISVLMVVKDKLVGLGLDADGARQFDEGINELGELDYRLAALMREHDDWQKVINYVQMSGAFLELDEDELRLTWRRVKRLVEPLFRLSDEEWADDFRAESKKMEDALAESERKKLGAAAAPESLSSPPAVEDSDSPDAIDPAKQSFDSYCEQIKWRFYKVDKALVELCDQLGKVGDELSPIVENL
jgi:hypothetical protein